MIVTVLPSFFDQFEYNPAQAFFAPLKLDHVRQRHAFEDLCQRQLECPITRCCRSHRLSNFVALRLDVGIEQSLADNAECQLHHLRPDVAYLPISPSCVHPLAVFTHDRGITRNAIAMECRLGQTSLPAVRFTFAEQHALAEEAPRTL